MKDGGPAFPRTGNDYQAGDNHKYHPGHEGMSLRDWFAGQALMAVFGNKDAMLSISAAGKATKHDFDDAIAAVCYGLSDAMLKARERSK